MFPIVTDDARSAIAVILATAVLRLRRSVPTEVLRESPATCLADSSELRLTVVPGG
jgi:hypothetical protein